MALQPYVAPGSASATSIINYAGREISEEERAKRIQDVRTRAARAAACPCAERPSTAEPQCTLCPLQTGVKQVALPLLYRVGI